MIFQKYKLKKQNISAIECTFDNYNEVAKELNAVGFEVNIVKDKNNKFKYLEVSVDNVPTKNRQLFYFIYPDNCIIITEDFTPFQHIPFDTIIPLNKSIFKILFKEDKKDNENEN